MNSSMSTHEAAPARLAGDATTSARAAQPPLVGCPGATLRDHFPRRRAPADILAGMYEHIAFTNGGTLADRTMAAVVGQIAGAS